MKNKKYPKQIISKIKIKLESYKVYKIYKNCKKSHLKKIKLIYYKYKNN